MDFLAMFEAQALESTCSVVTGSIHDPTTYSGLLCMPIPPKTEDDDITHSFLVKDTDEVLTTGARIVYNGDTYLVKSLPDRDGDYVRANCQVWHEAV
jgi:hypothetical protein